MNFVKNIKSSYVAEGTDQDRGDIVQTILLIAGFAIVTILAVNWIGTAILNKGADVATCIEGANSYNSGASNDNCKDVDHSKDHSFTKDDGYTSRYGN
jgi:hypothetical protein